MELLRWPPTAFLGDTTSTLIAQGQTLLRSHTLSLAGFNEMKNKAIMKHDATSQTHIYTSQPFLEQLYLWPAGCRECGKLRGPGDLPACGLRGPRA